MYVCSVRANLVGLPRPNKFCLLCVKIVTDKCLWESYIFPLMTCSPLRSGSFSSFFAPFGPSDRGEHLCSSLDKRAGRETAWRPNCPKHMERTGQKTTVGSRSKLLLEMAADAIQQTRPDSLSISSWCIGRLIGRSLGTNLPPAFYTRSKLIRVDW